MKNYYRPEIDGLRAIAVLSVIFFHAGISIFKGGFVGVDIFFVISGYLISTIILKDIEKKNFNINYFYQRRARRILPALIITIALTLPFALLLLPPDDLKSFAKSIFSSLTFWSNFQFSAESGYFEIPGEYKPLLHTWSLSIEEQFYIFWPLIIWTIYKIRINFLLIIFVLITLSFVLNIVSAESDKVATFYSPITRFCELLVGSFLAWLKFKNKFFYQL